ncbi:MAG: carbohydrate ABC transporter permease [Spirochaetaceae bacterium]
MATDARLRLRRRVILYTLLIAGAVFAVMPFLYMISNALKSYGETVTRVAPTPFHPRFWPSRLRFENFVIAWRDGDGLARYFINSVVIAGITLTGLYATTILSAYAFSKLRFPGRDLVFSVLIATLIIPETVLTIPNFLTVSRLGWLDRLPALTVPFMGSAFFIFLLRQFFNQIPDTLLEAATIDGSGHFGQLLRIVIPLSRAPLFTIGFLAFTGSWNSLQWPLVVTQSARWRPISVGLLRFISEAGPETQLRMAGALIALLPIILVYLLAQRQITAAISRTGITG